MPNWTNDDGESVFGEDVGGREVPTLITCAGCSGEGVHAAWCSAPKPKAPRRGGPRGTSNKNDRGSSKDRAARRAYLLKTYESDRGPGTCRCYRCGVLLDDSTITVDRIKPGSRGGRYTRDNIRPACADCNSATGKLAWRKAS